MPNPENIEKYKWKKGQSGNPKGRPPNRVPEQLIKIMGKAKTRKFYSLSNEELNMWERTVISMNFEQLNKLAKWDKAPAYPRALAMTILFETQNFKTTTIERLRDRQYSKVAEKLEVTGKDGESIISQARLLTKGEAVELVKMLENDY